MSKLIVLKDGAVVNEIQLGEGKLVIGRDQDCDVALGDTSVSRRHATVTHVFHEYFVEDLNSTNGTLLNDRTVTKHILKNGDVLRIGEVELRFESEQAASEKDDPERTTVIRPRKGVPPPAAARKVVPKVATLHFFRGPQRGRSEQINRSLYTIGQPGSDVAVIARRPQGFFLLRIGKESHPKINSKEVESSSGVQLHEGDLVEVGESLAEIRFEA